MPDDETVTKDRTRRRSILSTLIAVVAAFTLTAGIVTTWTEHTLFDDTAFADRSVALLDSHAVRTALAEEITDTLIDNGVTELVSFRSVAVTVITEAINTDGFKKIFREAVIQAHRAVFSEDGNKALLQLSDSLALFVTTLQVTYPDLAAKIPTDLNTTVIDVTDQIKGLALWEQMEDLRWMNETLLTAGLALMALVVVADPNRRIGVIKVGVALVLVGALVFSIAASAPRFAASFIAEPTVADAVSSAVKVFVQDLTNFGLWIVVIGVIVAAASSAVSPERPPMTLRAIYGQAETWYRNWQPVSDGGKIARGLAFVAIGGAILVLRDSLLPFVLAVGGAYIAYRGAMQIFQVVGRQRGTSLLPVSDGPYHGHRRLPIVIVAVVAFGLVSVGLFTSVASARNQARVASTLECNGHAELCDKRLDQVTFAGAHNAMSAANQPGWLFAENEKGIPAQLRYGIRALLVKSHYGVPTGVNVGGAELVVTDTAAELRANEAGAQDELTPEELERAKQLAASAPNRGAPKGVYLCHVACELGSIKFTEALGQLKTFLDRNPNEVVIWFIGDFVSADDTFAAFKTAGLSDRLWEGDPTDRSKPLPTLRNLIETGKNVIVFSEHSGQPPAWNNKGYGMWQDTPYTFASPDDFSCAKNRGPADAPLFQINHWITNKQPPSPVVAKQVNSYDVLMPAVKKCQQERGMQPNLVGVNFFGQGDLMRVVDELNGVS